jgi:hypothetical protein
MFGDHRRPAGSRWRSVVLGGVLPWFVAWCRVRRCPHRQILIKWVIHTRPEIDRSPSLQSRLINRPGTERPPSSVTTMRSTRLTILPRRTRRSVPGGRDYDTLMGSPRIGVIRVTEDQITTLRPYNARYTGDHRSIFRKRYAEMITRVSLDLRGRSVDARFVSHGASFPA